MNYCYMYITLANHTIHAETYCVQVYVGLLNHKIYPSKQLEQQ